MVIRRSVFFQVIGVCLGGVSVSGSVLFTEIAQSETLKHDLGSTRIGELVQMPKVENKTLNLPEGTLVFSQTSDLAVRVYNSDGQARMNLYNKKTGITERRGAPVTTKSTDTSVTYRSAGKSPVEIAIARSGKQTLTVNNKPQQDFGTVMGTVAYLPRIALPPNAIVEVSLVDISRADAPAITLSAQKIMMLLLQVITASWRTATLSSVRV